MSKMPRVTIFASAHPSGPGPMPTAAHMQALKQALLNRAAPGALAVVVDTASATYDARFTPAPNTYRVVLSDATRPLPSATAAAGGIIELCAKAYPACPNAQRCLLLTAEGGIDGNLSANAITIDAILAGAQVALLPRARSVATAPAAAAVAVAGNSGPPQLTLPSVRARTITDAVWSLMRLEDAKFGVCVAAFAIGVLFFFLPQYMEVLEFRAANATVLQSNLSAALNRLEDLQDRVSERLRRRGELLENISFLHGSFSKQKQMMEELDNKMKKVSAGDGGKK